jgi:hypothetical protein
MHLFNKLWVARHIFCMFDPSVGWSFQWGTNSVWDTFSVASCMKIPISLLEPLLKYLCSKQIKDHIEISDRRLKKCNVSTSVSSSLIFFNMGFRCAHTEIGSYWRMYDTPQKDCSLSIVQVMRKHVWRCGELFVFRMLQNVCFDFLWTFSRRNSLQNQCVWTILDFSVSLVVQVSNVKEMLHILQ